MDDKLTDYKWSGSRTKLLLALYKERKRDLQDPKIRKRTVWCEIAQEMEKNNIKGLDVDKVERKFRNLKQTYSKIRNRNKSTGQMVTKWEFFKDMEDIFDDDCTIVNCSSISSYNGENSENSMSFNDSDDVQKYSPSDEEGSSLSFLKSSYTDEVPNFCKKKNASIQKQRYSQTNKIIKIEEERNESFLSIANAMEESNRLFKKYISYLESQTKDT